MRSRAVPGFARLGVIWMLDENGFVAPETTRDELWAARHRAILNCSLCDNDGYRSSAVCDHVDHSETAKRGMDRVREAMGWT